MKFATRSESAAWCSQHGHRMPSHSFEFPPEETHWRHEFKIPSDAGRRVALCRALWDHGDEQRTSHDEYGLVFERKERNHNLLTSLSPFL